MKRIGLLLLSLLLFSSTLSADVPRSINYQGILTDDTGTPLEGTYDLTFRIYEDSLTSTDIWTESHTSVQIDAGLFSLLLGSKNPLWESLFAGSERWLGITVEPDAELAPRMRMTSVPWALRAAAADTASSVDWSAITGIPAGFADGVDDTGGAGDGHSLDAADGSPTDAVYVDNDGNAGVGTTAPSDILDVVMSGASGEKHGFSISNPSTYNGYPTLSFNIGGEKIADILSHQVGQHLLLETMDGKGNIQFYPENTFMTTITPTGVGIGESEPTEMLDVAGTVKATAFVGDGSGLTGLPLIPETDPTVPDSIKDGIDWAEIGGIPADLLDGDDVGSSYWTESGGNIYRETGNIGIGTAGPAEKLDIRIPDAPGLFEGLGIRSSGSTQGYPTLIFKVGSTKVASLFSHQNGAHLYLRTEPGRGNILFQPENTDIMIATPSGVGLGGISEPTEMLDVAGTVKATAFVGDGSGLTGLPGPLTEAQVDAYTDNNGYLMEEIDPTVPDSIKDGIEWAEIGGIPADLLDGDDVGSSYWTESSGNIYRDTGNVGIGVSDPLAKLHVATTDGGELLFTHGETDLRSSIRTEFQWSADQNALIFKVSDGTASGQRDVMTLRGTGKVGIGTTDPQDQLDVLGSLRLSRTSGYVANWRQYVSHAGSNYGSLYFNPSESTGDFIVVNSSGSELFYIDTSEGDVGIGTTTPTEKLEVGGTVKATAFVGDGSGLTGLPADTSWTEIGGDVYRETGNVGVGTTTPTEKLDVDGNLNVTGTISIGTVTRYFSLPGSALRPSDNEISYTSDEYWLQSLESTFAGFTAPVNLPHGAVVTELKGWVYDNDPGGNMALTLKRVRLSDRAEWNMAQIVPSDSPSVQELTDSSVDLPTIDNGGSIYYITWGATKNTHQLYAVRIAYTINKPLP